ncbi:helix-turn-helix domain-containing protein [Edaphobacillus lindanitolerans]|uniref:DNA-binding transcriptional regulator, PucR family n=1 Tax=Edaphobacillus lindanitolerans TaxID=550447 RepID=A0A1U7PNJ2_9BACI|nr:helix-turn-helix domain-containing protein [Edaphobacillus lindanitolerans]SIT73456.1 DNA-binding transcriptional regulator, PucR family [Edaphobacillus lindanitolerans]
MLQSMSDKVTKLLELNKILTRSLQLKEVLENLVHAAKELVNVADVFIIYLYNEDTDTLCFAEGAGVNKEYMERLSFRSGESIAGKIFQQKAAKLFTSEREIDDYMENMTADNYRYYFEGVGRRKIKSAFCIPIVNKETCLGVVAVNNFNHNGVFSTDDMQIIEMLTDQSAIAIDNSNVYQALKEKNHLLKQSFAIHDRFYKTLLDGRGVEEVLSLLKGMISSEVRFHENQYGRQDGFLFPVGRDTDLLGQLELEKPFGAFSEIEQTAIEQASLVIALEVIKENAIHAKEIHFREEVFNQLLDGDLYQALQYIRWNPRWNVQCLIVEGKEAPLWNTDRLVDKESFVKSVEHLALSICPDSLIFTKAFQLIIIVPVFSDSAIRDMIEGSRSLWSRQKKFYFGIGRQTSVNELSISYKEAMRSVKYGKLNDQDIVEYTMLGIERLLYEVNPEILAMFANDKLGKLKEMNHAYLETLQCLIETDKNHKETAERLHIHPNTLYYRLKKIEETLQVNMNHGQEWMDLVIAFRLLVSGGEKEQ